MRSPSKSVPLNRKKLIFREKSGAPCRSLEWGMQILLRILDLAPLADARDSIS